jgi:hypothetical protein
MGLREMSLGISRDYREIGIDKYLPIYYTYQYEYRRKATNM